MVEDLLNTGMTSIIPSAVLQFSDQNGAPYAGGSLTFYVPGTLTLKSTFQDYLGTIANTNPVILDAAGRATIWGSGLYQMVLADAEGNQVFSQVTESALPESAISAAMLPVTGAGTLQTARTLMGIDYEIGQAIAAIELLPGPIGPTGGAGPTGPAGAVGPTGSAAAGSSQSNANPGYFKTDTGFTLQFGNGVTAGDGTLTVSFPLPFINATAVTATTLLNPINLVIRVASVTAATFEVFIEDTDNHGGESAAFAWMAMGFS